MTGGSTFRAIAPYVIGLISSFAYSGGFSRDGNRYGSILVFGFIAIVGFSISWRLWKVTRDSINRDQQNARMES
eukprot:CAMPEP_0202462784 /NCGR_PEP_ID=MMETSP1360-20130828/55430_1 /ASSEMBLY_ACC=CAM_ASM_000848 /TAXON_ID=515479 /ORGANISM="Licmophora paradoxa, Strain CCMP2313" /LENGTH=73 /DNA_ID=CAMNT_0049085403 /DNA_START=68 /DNA_END=289 /DNA_ORIENTATION=-